MDTMSLQRRCMDLREPTFLASLTADECKFIGRVLMDVNVENEHELICYCDECLEEASRRWEAKHGR